MLIIELDGFAIPNGRAIPKIPSFMINTDNMAVNHSLISRFFCMNGSQQYCTERTRGPCKRRLKIPGRFLIKFLFLGLNFAKVNLLRCFSFSLTICILNIFNIVRMNIYM